MIEDGPDSFLQRWRPYAADATLFPRPEGRPLLEAEIAGRIVQLFERTNPYDAPPGPARLIVHATATRIDAAEAETKELNVPTLGALAGCGEVLYREGGMVVLDAGAPLVVGVPGEGGTLPDATWLRFEASAPVHAFVLPPPRHGPQEAGSIDDAP